MSVCILYPVCSLQSAVCILYLVCILYPVCSLQSAVCSLHFVLTGYEIDLLCLSPNYTFKVCLQRECGINNEVKNRFMKCLGNNSYLSELFLAGPATFIAKHIAKSPSHFARDLSNGFTVISFHGHFVPSHFVPK